MGSVTNTSGLITLKSFKIMEIDTVKAWHITDTIVRQSTAWDRSILWSGSSKVVNDMVKFFNAFGDSQANHVDL